MSIDIRVTVNDAALKRAINDPKLIAGPIQDFLSKSALAIEKTAKEKVPVDTGRLRASIATQLAPLRAVVGTPLDYAAPVEFGSKPHFPPPLSIYEWVRRNRAKFGLPKQSKTLNDDIGQIAYLVMRKIATKGIKEKPYMRPAVEDNKATIEQYLNEAAKAIEENWRAHGS